LNQRLDQVQEEGQLKDRSGQAMLVNWINIKDNLPTKFKISPLTYLNDSPKVP
jgi:hypothetical protein